jgi:DNA mismatch endonuclease (patch repair protein)
MEAILRQRLEGGTFGDVPEKRTRTMRAVRGKGNKTTELCLRMALVREGLSGWVMHVKGLPGTPDFLFQKQKLAVFVDGCFWHGCRRCGHYPKTNSEYWKSKIMRNRARDRQAVVELRKCRIRVLRIWEHSLKSRELSRILATLHTLVDCNRKTSQLSLV